MAVNGYSRNTTAHPRTSNAHFRHHPNFPVYTFGDSVLDKKWGSRTLPCRRALVRHVTETSLPDFPSFQLSVRMARAHIESPTAER